MSKTPAGMVRLWHDGGGCSVDGREYPADAEGFVTVPMEAAAHLVAAHGFREDKPEGEPEAAAKENAKGAKA